MFNDDIIKLSKTIFFCVVVLIILWRLFEGKKPPVETSVIDKLKPLNNRTPEKVSKVNIKAVIKVYKLWLI